MLAVLCALLLLTGCQGGMATALGTPPAGFSAAPPPPLPPIVPSPQPPPPSTSATYVYPARGQSPQQEQFDKGECYSWAVQQTGFDPANPRVATGPPPTPGMPQGGLFRGAAGGAALGAVGGAIGGDAGEGAAIGAGVGALFGLMRRARWAEEQQQAQQGYMAQQQSALAQGRANYNQAFRACMTGRGYTVN